MEDVKPLDGWVNRSNCLLPYVLYWEGMWHLEAYGSVLLAGDCTRGGDHVCHSSRYGNGS